ncbi:MAG: UDP-N-acetylmuramate dehydrogenase [Candidatus Omnitrophota bacterium]
MDCSISNSKDLNVSLENDVPLARFTTFALGGRCPCVATCTTKDGLLGVVRKLNEAKQKFIVLGGGSNCLVADEGVDACVVRYVHDQPVIKREGNTLDVSAATPVDQLAAFAAEQGLSGINFLSGILGTVGGAVAGNSGAFGKQISDSLLSVTLLKENGQMDEVGPGSLAFGYRDSLLKKTHDIVFSVKISLVPGEKEKLLAERDAILAERKDKHPEWTRFPTAGSFFKNIVSGSPDARREPAGWYLEQAGVKDLCVNGACVFPKHANIIIKTKDCSAQDVYDLSQLMQKAVLDKFGIQLVREVRCVGKFKGMPEGIEELIW